jgi:hypothetical protein
MSIKIVALTVVVIAFGLYEIAHGYHQSRRYSLRFLLVGGLLTGIPFLAAGIILVFSQGEPVGNWKYLVLAAWAFGVLWETWQRRKYYRANPD